MRFSFNATKSAKLRANPQRGIGFEEVRSLFKAAHIIDHRSDDPQEFRAVGWVCGLLYSVIFEVREDTNGEIYHLVRRWKTTREEKQAYAQNIDETGESGSAR